MARLWVVKSAVFAALMAFFLTMYQGAQAQSLVNGSFASGNLAGWTVFTTSGGTNGIYGGYPQVASFNVTGGGAQNAALFNVGSGGGGITQDITFAKSETFSFSADFASTSVSNNADGGTFDLLVDNNIVASDAVGFIGVGDTVRGSLSTSGGLSAGQHVFGMEITRAYGSGGVDSTPSQYVTNFTLTPAAAPEASTLVGFATGITFLGVMMAWRRRKPAQPA
jgi:hypothetical protein